MKSTLKQQFMKLKQKKSQQANFIQPLRKDKNQEQIKRKPSKNQFKSQKQAKQAKNLFKNITFCFPYFDVQLTQKQVEIIKKQITNQGGKILEYHQDLYFQPLQYVLISSKVRVQLVEKKIEQKLNYIDILDYNYIPCCIAEGETIDPSKFSLKNQQKNQRKFSNQSSGKKKRKLQQQGEQFVEKRSLTEQLPSDQNQNDSDIPKKQKQKRTLDKNKFFCQAGKQQNKPAMNKFIQEQLLKLQNIYANQRDIGRRIAYGKAASLIRTWKQEIKTQQDVDKIMGIGPKINKKIKQIVATGKLTKLQQLNQSQEVVAMGQLSKIWGIGPAKAKELYKEGIKSIQDLRKNQSSLTKNQKIGLKYYQDFEVRIPRQKVARMFEFVRKTLNSIVKNPQTYKAQVCGSYRRGKATCGDMDIIITRNDGVFEKDLLVKLVAQLQKVRFLTQNLSEPKCDQGHVSTSYMGVCKFQDQTHHRIDIKHYPFQEYAFALLYFTGSGMFNRSMRLYATKLGLQLSDKGFARRPQKNEIYWSKPIPVCYAQEDVFKVLGLDYRSPKQRDD